MFDYDMVKFGKKKCWETFFFGVNFYRFLNKIFTEKKGSIGQKCSKICKNRASHLKIRRKNMQENVEFFKKWSPLCYYMFKNHICAILRKIRRFSNFTSFFMPYFCLFLSIYAPFTQLFCENVGRKIRKVDSEKKLNLNIVFFSNFTMS